MKPENELDFQIEVVEEMPNPRDNSKVRAGCWGTDSDGEPYC